MVKPVNRKKENKKITLTLPQPQKCRMKALANKKPREILVIKNAIAARAEKIPTDAEGFT
jgi:hypothetical protein